MLKNKFLIFALTALMTVGIMGSAMAAQDYSALREANGGKKADSMRFLDTTEPSVIFTFGGLTHQGAVADVLNRMAANGMGGTFFVTEKELKHNAATVAMIANYGQELGIGIATTQNKDFNSFCREIESIQNTMAQRYGVRPKVVRQLFGEPNEELQEAVSAMGCILVSQTVNVVQTRDKDATTPDEVMPLIFGKFTLSMGRGQIAYIRLDFYTHENMAGDMMMAIKQQKVDSIAYRSPTDTPELNPNNDSAYRIRGVAGVYNDTKYRYTYPITSDKIPENLRPENRTFYFDDKSFMDTLKARYIGAPGVNGHDRIFQFSDAEINRLDQTGVVKSVRDNTIFLTFDDWATDRSLNRLLYVLRKHKVHGTFFIITRSMLNNRNLLRVIANEGHEIAAHTDQHIPMSNNWVREAGDDRVQNSDEYYLDVSTCYSKLASVVGDVKVNGKYALKRYLRAPTLAISKTGLTNILDAGYEFIVSGYESTEDYVAPNRQTMVAAIQHGIYRENGKVRPGSIIIMHMTDNAKYTAEALDILLSANELLPDGDPRKFKVGILGDYLKEGYRQDMQQIVK